MHGGIRGVDVTVHKPRGWRLSLAAAGGGCSAAAVTADELEALGRLGGTAAAGLTSHVEHLHRTIADRSFGPTGPASRPVRVVHDRIAGTVYSAVRGSVRGAGAVAGVALRGAARPGGAPLGSTPGTNFAIAAVNAVAGHRLDAEASPLRIRTAVRKRGADVPADPEALARAFPAATPKLAVFLHGLGENESTWRLRSGAEGVTYGSRLAADLGHTPVYLRYNTGRHVSDNGVDVSALLTDVVRSWPVPVDEVAIIGHSMGGLVARAACQRGEADGAPWVPLVRHVVYLGSPHAGAIAARSARYLGWALAKVPETRPYASLLDHSPGIRDLRYGYVAEDDWRDCDAGTCLEDHGSDVPLLASATHHVVSGTLVGDGRTRMGRAVGDLLVQADSAHGRHRHRQPVGFADGVNRPGLHHFDLLNHPDVYEVVRDWLA